MPITDASHEPIYCEAALMLGQMHRVLLTASSEMDNSCREGTLPDATGFRRPRNRTALGREVAGDEIHWWVFKKERDLGTLEARTRDVLDSAQFLKDAAAQLRSRTPSSYDELLCTLRTFTGHNQTHIRKLLDYAQWLESKSRLAPSMLFAFRIWGSTRLSDRWGGIDFATLGMTPEELNKQLTLVALGLHLGTMLEYDRAHLDVFSDICESRDPEDPSDVEIPDDEVLTRTAWAVSNNVSTYFVCLRDSLRNILLDIEKRLAENELIDSDEFWRGFILKAIKTRKLETGLWDFKETLSMWRAQTGKARDEGRVTFAEDVASFANARGGVLVIGVKDGTRELVGLGGRSHVLEDQLKDARRVISTHLDLQGDLVRFQQVAVPDKGVEKLCLVVIVAQSRTPVGAGDGNGRYTFPVRHETGIDKVARSAVSTSKANVAVDNYEFVSALNRFVLDN